jgi:hypothetical protein
MKITKVKLSKQPYLSTIDLIFSFILVDIRNRFANKLQDIVISIVLPDTENMIQSSLYYFHKDYPDMAREDISWNVIRNTDIVS